MDFVPFDTQAKRLRCPKMPQLPPGKICYAVSEMIDMDDSADDSAVLQSFTFEKSRSNGILNYRPQLPGADALCQGGGDRSEDIATVES